MHYALPIFLPKEEENSHQLGNTTLDRQRQQKPMGFLYKIILCIQFLNKIQNIYITLNTVDKY